MNGRRSALELWREKVEYLLREEAIASDPEKKFQLKILIGEARQKIAELDRDAEPKITPPGLECDRAFIVENLSKYRWYDTQYGRVKVQNPLCSSLEHVLSYCVHTDHRFLNREQLLNGALALMEMSWSQTRALHLNEVGQRAFELAEKEYCGQLHPMAYHLYQHNRIDSTENGVYAVWGLFNEPVRRDVADAAIDQTERAWEPLRGLKDALPFWNRSLEEMVAYQQACRIVHRVIHPDAHYYREARHFLDALRERVVSMPSLRSHLMRAELSYALRCRPRSVLLELLEKYADEASAAGNADEERPTSLLQLNLLAESRGSLGDKGIVAKLLNMPPMQREFFLLRDRHIILPSARFLLLNYISNRRDLIPLDVRDEFWDLLRVPAVALYSNRR